MAGLAGLVPLAFNLDDETPAFLLDSEAERLESFSDRESTEGRPGAFCCLAWEWLDASLPESVYKLEVLRVVLAILLGIVLVGVPIVLQDFPEPQALSFFAIIGLYVAWALVQNKLVRIYSSSTRPTQVGRIWAQLTAEQVDHLGSHNDLGEFYFQVWQVTRPRRRRRSPAAVSVRDMVGVQVLSPLRSVTSCCCCYQDFAEAEPENPAIVLQCGHMFCLNCIACWSSSGRSNSGTCPVCRYDFSAEL
ncbi:unnamed protein product [Durusdinium trenchii]|uniref:Uncharacterized protein n=2 Tax=Durusdinium trenchii TaxID=1381693 RepID=A0ABP0S0T6_9DINO